MSRAARWQTWVPRLLLVVVAALGVQYALGRASRQVVMRHSEGALGARVEIGNTRVSAIDRQVVMHDLRMLNPRSQADELLEADRCELTFAPGPLLEKKAVVERGRLSGLRFSLFSNDVNNSAARGTAAAEAAAAGANWIANDDAGWADQWLAHLSDRLKRNVVDQLDSVERTEQLCAQWSRESAAIEARGQQLNQRLAELQKSVAAAQENPLRSGRVIGDLPNSIAELQQAYAELNGDLAKLPDRLETERRAIVAARRLDEAQVRKQTTLAPVEANALSSYLLRNQAAQPLEELVAWLRWLRETGDESVVPIADKPRGEDILFGGCKVTPSLIVKSLELRGAARIANQPVELRGKLTGWSSQLATADSPVKIQLAATGSMPIELQAIVDRTHGAKRDTLLVDCEGILLPGATLGCKEKLVVGVAPSVGSLLVSLALDGEKLTGDIQIVQKNARLTPALGGELADLPVGNVFGETLGRVDSFATRISLSGTLAKPECKLWSSLGPAVAEAMQRALERANNQHAREMLTQAGKLVDERLTTIEQQMTEQQSRWATRNVEAQSQLRVVAANQTGPERISREWIGRGLPSGSLFR